MGYAVDDLVAQQDDLLSIAALHVRDVDAICTDVAATIFPSAIQPASDAVISAVSTKLLQLVSDVEAKITRTEIKFGTRPSTWQLLAQSGFLREADLVDFALARVCEDRLEAMLPPSTTTFIVDLLDHPDGGLAEAAQLLLAADSLHRRTMGGTYSTLPPELLHKLCWRIVAALEVTHGSRSAEVIDEARKVLAAYDERQTAKSAARKIVHLIDETSSSDLLDPAKSGLHLFVAKLASETGLEHDHILRLIDCGSIAPLAVILASIGVLKPDASTILVLLRGSNLTPKEVGVFNEKYALLDKKSATDQIASWSVLRSNYLAFGAL